MNFFSFFTKKPHQDKEPKVEEDKSISLDDSEKNLEKNTI